MSINPLKVRVEALPGKQLGGLMNDMRAWLDNQNIQAAEFKVVPIGQCFVVQLTFFEEDQAERFGQRFGGA